MKICSSHMKVSALSLLLINSFCAFSQIPHEIIYIVGCFYNGTTEIQSELDGEELLFVDFSRDSVVNSIPRFLVDDPSQIVDKIYVIKNAQRNKDMCAAIIAYCKAAWKNPPEEMNPPESVLYPSEEIQLGVENSLICFVNHFYPPQIKVTWIRNGLPVAEGMSLSRYYPNDDQTFHQFSTLTFTPREGDIYNCTVEHLALKTPKTMRWEPEFSHRSLGPDVYCGAALTLGLLGVVVGTILIVKGRYGL